MQPEQRASIPITAAMVALMSAVLFQISLSQIAGNPVISEIYGGGGNTGALFTHDFIELYNPTPTAVTMTGWSVQYQSGGGTGPFSSVAVISGTIPAHGFFLVQGNPGSGGTLALPDPDAVAAISMGAGSGKVALVGDSLSVSAPTDSTVIDFVGYGSANQYEGTGPAPSPGNTSSIERKAGPGSTPSTMEPGGADEHAGNGWDAGDNGADFLLRSVPEPQNSAAVEEIPGGGMSISVGYDPRWNLVSVPLLVDDPAPGAVFPAAISPLYGYDGGYAVEDTAAPGRGYWMKFSSADTVSFSGSQIATDTITLTPGWNLVGSISVPVDVESVIQIPAGHLETGFYSYEGGYLPAAVIVPGRAYWVKSLSGGIVILQ